MSESFITCNHQVSQGFTTPSPIAVPGAIHIVCAVVLCFVVWAMGGVNGDHLYATAKISASVVVVRLWRFQEADGGTEKLLAEVTVSRRPTCGIVDSREAAPNAEL